MQDRQTHRISMPYVFDLQATFEELGFDSLDGVEMVVAMEENFGFGIH